MMTIGFRLFGVDITKHHFSSPAVVMTAAADRFTVDRVVRQPGWAPAALETYVCFRGRKG
jgi:hypothetical protein